MASIAFAVTPLPPNDHPTPDAVVRFAFWANQAVLTNPASQNGYQEFVRSVNAGYVTKTEDGWRRYLSWRHAPLPEQFAAGLSHWYGFENAVYGTTYQTAQQVATTPGLNVPAFWAGYTLGAGSFELGTPDTMEQLARNAPGRLPDRVLTEEDFGIIRDPNFIEYPGSDGRIGSGPPIVIIPRDSPYATPGGTIDAPIQPWPSIPTQGPNDGRTGVPLVTIRSVDVPRTEVAVVASQELLTPQTAANAGKWFLIAVGVVLIVALVIAARRR